MKIAIAGYATEGRINYSYWSQKYPEAEITIVDQKELDDAPYGVATIIGEDAFEKLQDFDLVVRTAGLPPYKITTNGKIWSATNEFFENCPAPIIGITGSKGKGTTASLIDSILKAAGRTTWLVGNIGQPSLELIEQIQSDDVVVYELSSFQLWDLARSPETAVITIIEPDHLDVHVDFEDYIAAKAHITKHQTLEQAAFYRPGDTWSQHIAEAGPEGRDVRPYIDMAGVHIEGESFYNNEELICSASAVQLPGAHNLDNACAAISAALEYDGVTYEAIEAGLRAFHGLPHRLHLVREVNEVRYYDDSIATTPTSAIAALRSFDQPKVIILGGSYKGADFSELAEELTHHDVRALLIGDEAPRLLASLQNANFTNFEIVLEPTMPKVVRHAAEVAEPGSVVLLSPAAASFGLFKNYSDRGEQFVAAVNAL
jgi:UDP-N-acetylmuramoylalanine--D-glutamate ligase